MLHQLKRTLMKISPIEHDKLKSFEESLWLEETRFNHSYMDNLLAENFFEFGRSGKIYSRSECLAIEQQPILAKLPLENFKLHHVSENTVLITYISEVTYESVQRANRSSLWVKDNGSWKLRFHQGTPCE
jgi:hypothetical protein